MASDRRPDVDDEDEDESATSVAHVPESLLQSLRHPERAPATVRPPAPTPVQGAGDEDESSTLVAAGARKVPMHRASAASAPQIPPPPAVPRPATKSQIDRFEAETEGSPDEDPSDTAMGAKIPQAVMRHLSQRPPPAPGAPMFEPPSPEMFDPPPPDPLAVGAPLAATAKARGSRLWLAIVALLVLVGASGAAYYFFVLRR